MLARALASAAVLGLLGCGPDLSKIVRIGISGEPALLPGEDAAYAATAFNALQEELGGKRFTWSSSDPSVAVVNPSTGTLFARAPGTTTLTATTEGVTGALPLTVRTPTSPLGRAEARLVYNPKLQRVMLFGGMGRAQSLGDLWSWDGTAWRVVSLGGPRRSRAAVAWDTARDRLVVYGGTETQDDGSAIATVDTWEWDGVSWTQRAVAGPPRRRDMAGGFDPVRQRAVVYGGFEDGNPDAALYDTWEWDGATWVRAATTSPASARFEQPSNAVHSASHGGLVVVAGSALSQNASTIMRWSAGAWTTLAAGPSASPPIPITVNTASGALVIFDESSNPPGATRGETWLQTGTAAPTRVNASNAPPDRFGSAIAYDPLRSRVVLFGGVAGPSRFSETWLFDGTAWTLAAP